MSMPPSAPKPNKVTAPDAVIQPEQPSTSVKTAAGDSKNAKPKIIASAFISSAPKKATKKRPATAPKPPPSGSCRKFWALGRCEYGDGCKYSHTANPDVTPQAPPPPSACKKYWVDGRCDFGDNCKFPHLSNPAIDPESVAENAPMSYKKAMKLGGGALDLNRWMDPKKVDSYCVAPPTDAVMLHGSAPTSTESRHAADGVDLPSADIDAELAALQRMLAPQVLAKVKRQLAQPEADGSVEAAAAVVHSCTCHLMPGFNAQTGAKLVPCFNCNTAALAEKKALQASVQSRTEASSVWVPQLDPVGEDAPGEENFVPETDAMAALLDKIDGAKASSVPPPNEQTTVKPNAWAEWEQWQKENGFEADEEES